jgi:uncharacterized protein (DUF433 family)
VLPGIKWTLTFELMPATLDRITVNPEQCGGRPCIRNMRIRVSDVIDLIANGLTVKEVLEEMPDLENEDVRQALSYASARISHPVLKVA